MAEARFQSKVVNWLRKKGCYVLVTSPRPGIPDGCPDVIALLDGGGWVALELKKSAKEKYQPLQKATIKKLNDMYYSKVVYDGKDSNWEEVKCELLSLL